MRMGFIGAFPFSASGRGRRVRPALRFPVTYEVIASDTSSWDFEIAFCSSS